MTVKPKLPLEKMYPWKLMDVPSAYQIGTTYLFYLRDQPHVVGRLQASQQRELVITQAALVTTEAIELFESIMETEKFPVVQRFPSDRFVILNRDAIVFACALKGAEVERM